MPEAFFLKSFLTLTLTWFSNDLTELSGFCGYTVTAPLKEDWDLGACSVVPTGAPDSFLKHDAAVADIIAYKFCLLAFEPLFLLVFYKNLFCFGIKSRLLVR